MATVILQATGMLLGSVFGPLGAAVGRTAGALAGYALDRALLSGGRTVEGARLSGGRTVTADEGAPIARVYGTARVSGTIIWATRFEEVRTVSRRGGKGGGPRTAEHAYFGNVAIGLCEGPVACIRRVWADGREIDLDAVEFRLHRGTETQEPDPLIEAKQGTGNTPAYRGLAYVVFERLPLAAYGNRIPQIQVEVVRPVGALEQQMTAVCLIPGATEHGLEPLLVTAEPREGDTQALNRHVLHGTTDFDAAVDELVALCPNLRHVALVVSWYGNDLRAGSCAIRPGVTTRADGGESVAWQVSGQTRATAHLVSSSDGRAAYGGTPTDRSVIAAIAALKARGLHVTFYPFVLMDVPAGNVLPDPDGGAAQAAYPWRGRITCHPAAGQPGSADGTALGAAQVAAFCGVTTNAHFSVAGGSVSVSPAADFGYRRMVLHCAHVCAAAGGVDAFLIGSELRGLTRIRDAGGGYPFVEQLRLLASDVRAVLGPSTRLTYGADWSEYFGHPVGPARGDIRFNLDPLWADANIDAIGIDNYMPLSDWRDGDALAGNPDGMESPADTDAMRAAIGAGEGFHWFYANGADRLARMRTPIADGLSGKDWVYRPKDIAGWWSSLHFDRTAGVESTIPTAWLPGSKPVWFTELGCPAVDKGANQPNLFPDPKSSESGLPYFSNGARDDDVQRAFLSAHLAHWGTPGSHNPAATAYGGRMVDADRIYAWAWDARPWPGFPLRSDVWGDGENWQRGHWLNGRLGQAPVADAIRAVLTDHGVGTVAVEGVDGAIHGMVVPDPTTARSAIEPLAHAFGIHVFENGDTLAVRSGRRAPVQTIRRDDIVDREGLPLLVRTEAQPGEVPGELRLSFRDPLAGHAPAMAATLPVSANAPQALVDTPFSLEAPVAGALADAMLADFQAGRRRVSFALPPSDLSIAPGTVFRLDDGRSDEVYVVTRAERGDVLTVEAQSFSMMRPAPRDTSGPLPAPQADDGFAGPPLLRLMDLPLMPGSTPEASLKAAVWSRPWTAQALLASPGVDGFALRATIPTAAITGRLIDALGPGCIGLPDRKNAVRVALAGGELAAIARPLLLAGGNLAAVQAVTGVWELLQFEQAEETALGEWRLTTLLRAQLGTEDAMVAGAGVGASFVLLDQAVVPAGLAASEIGLDLNWRAGPAIWPLDPLRYRAATAAGGVRALRPLSPVHVRAQRSGADIVLRWIRRTRVDGDSWLGDDVPLGETTERYRVRIRDAGGAIVRTAEASIPEWPYPAALQIADHGAAIDAVDVELVQLNERIGEGVPVRRLVPVAA